MSLSPKKTAPRRLELAGENASTGNDVFLSALTPPSPSIALSTAPSAVVIPPGDLRVIEAATNEIDRILSATGITSSFTLRAWEMEPAEYRITAERACFP